MKEGIVVRIPGLHPVHGSFILLLLIAVPVFSQPRAGSSDIGQIKKLMERQAADWNKGNIDGYMEGYWKSDSLLFSSGGNVRRGWMDTFEKYRKSYDSRAKMGTLRFSELEISLLSSASAWVFGRWELERENDRPGGVFTLLLRKFPVGWRIIHDHTSSFSHPDTAKTKQ